MKRRTGYLFVALSLFMFASSEVWAASEIRFATLTSISKAPPSLVAQAKGFFKKNGVAVKMKLFASGKSAIEAVAAGQFDIVMSGDIPILALLGQGYPGKIIAVGGGGPKRQALLVRTNAPYKNLNDLKGKRIGLTRGSTDDIALEATIKKVGLKWSDFTLINLQPANKAVALKTGGVDAVEAWEPVPSIIATKGIGKRILTADGDIPDVLGLIVASDQILKQNPDGVIRFLRAMQEGAVYAASHPNEMVGFLSKKLKLDRSVLIQAIPTQWWYIEPHSDTLVDCQRSVRLIYNLKRISKPFQCSDVSDFSYIEKALAKHYPLKKSASEALKYPVVTVTN